MGVDFVRRMLFSLVAALTLTACASFRAPEPRQVALLAPFEGRYRDVGYEALYAARLALAEIGDPHLTLLAVDDGGTLTSAGERAQALAQDSQVLVALVLGDDAAHAETQISFGDVPVLIVGHWATAPATDSALMLSSSQIAETITLPPETSMLSAVQLGTPLIGDERLALGQFSELRLSLDNVTIVSSSSLPDRTFAERYRGDDPFAPEPGLLATLTYDATHVAAAAIRSTSNQRSALLRTIQQTTYTRINGEIAFDDGGYWQNAPVNRFGFNEIGRLTPLNNLEN